MGFMFNLLRILEFSVEPTRDRDYLRALFRALVAALPNATHSLYFLVLNYFFQHSQNNAQLTPAPTKLASLFVNFLREEGIGLEQLLQSLKI